MSERNEGDLPGRYDVVVIGGGAAGLSGALMLGRSRRSVLVVDDRRPRNAPAEGVHGFLGHEGTPPGELLATGREEVQRYGGRIVHATATTVERRPDGFRVHLDDHSTVDAPRLLVTTGLVDELPDVPGVAELWGSRVLHCPYCHGWEVRDRAIGVLATGPLAAHQAQMWTQWTDQVTLFTHTADLADEDRSRLGALGVDTVDGKVSAVEREGDGPLAVRLDDGRTAACDAVVVGTRMRARADFLVSLGLETVPVMMGPSPVAERIETDGNGRTAVPGVWAAGNVADPRAQVLAAAAAGATAAVDINMELIAEAADRAGAGR
jgi:thioredoxin reductase